MFFVKVGMPEGKYCTGCRFSKNGSTWCCLCDCPIEKDNNFKPQKCNNCKVLEENNIIEHKDIITLSRFDKEVLRRAQDRGYNYITRDICGFYLHKTYPRKMKEPKGKIWMSKGCYFLSSELCDFPFIDKSFDGRPYHIPTVLDNCILKDE